ncbi:thioesterase family protein, putative [Talaromyces stipitatus ATCC 10500]|uniref:Thioesterase family protein, putative n=1 Tax=Talaromyces stipitatus (strain ATCC 10500 / CBS 375.48 / QM 6759 / NRRL 1006) TaxID=441959 RepID=B8M8W1_TALSN|nr:thioesterase family protein, putative [Talaromyces stipitatus ATCC 10500]EED20624.1 thioesterase family protein, putative [Talaromyces stipitatus ATCC 10500]
MGVDSDTSAPKPEGFAKSLDARGLQLLQIDAEHGIWSIDRIKTKIRVESATEGPPARATFRLFVTPNMCNPMGNLHGGCSATIIDILTSLLALSISKPGVFELGGGVSRNLNVTFLRPVPADTDIRVVVEVTQMGKRFALMRTEIRRAEDNVVCVLSEHQKVNIDPPSRSKL